MNILFWIAAAVAVVSTALAISRPSPVRGLVYFVVSLLAVAVIFFLNGDGQVTWAEQVQRELLLSLEVSELGLIFLPTSPVDGRVEGYVNDPTNDLLIFCIDTNTQQITWGHCA